MEIWNCAVHKRNSLNLPSAEVENANYIHLIGTVESENAHKNLIWARKVCFLSVNITLMFSKLCCCSFIKTSFDKIWSRKSNRMLSVLRSKFENFRIKCLVMIMDSVIDLYIYIFLFFLVMQQTRYFRSKYFRGKGRKRNF